MPKPSGWADIELADAGAAPVATVLSLLGSSLEGLQEAEAARRLSLAGPNSIGTHGVRGLAVFGRQLKNPLLILLVTAASVSFWVGEKTDALLILGIIALSVGLGFYNEYRSEKAAAELHDRIRHHTVAVRGSQLRAVDATELVPGDVVQLDVGDVVPADLRLLEVHSLECDESILTGEAMPTAKTSEASPAGSSLLDLDACAFMGTVVRGGTGRAVVVRTGGRTAFGTIARDLTHGTAQTAFQMGLRDFSLLLVYVTVTLCVSIFVINALLRHPLLESALFALAIAVGLTPQLLPAIVTVSLAFGAKQMARRSVLVKRLVSIEDLGNMEVLFTDKTGTLTEGQISFVQACDAAGRPSDEVLRLGLLCTSAAVQDGHVVGGNPLDRALWDSAAARRQQKLPQHRLAELPFDYERRLMSVLIRSPEGALELVTKGAPEEVLARCGAVPSPARAWLDAQFEAGGRVVAVGQRPAPGVTELDPSLERELQLAGFLVFTDPPKAAARPALARLHRLEVTVKVITGDNQRVARKVCTDLGMKVAGALNGSEVEAMTDQQLARALPGITIFARVTPEQKSRIVKTQRSLGTDVGFMGDGVNDAVALHAADVGISVDSATDVAKDAADIVLLDKDLGVLAEGIVEGRRIFANTIKYVLMGTSSNFGNMFSAAGASLFLPFLPMTPTQILLNNLLYDISEMTIPTDEVDEERLLRPAHWNLSFIRRFMLVFGPISSIFDFLTFGMMVWIFHASGGLFQSGWFVESLATQTLVIFVIRTRRVPFFRSRPSRPLLLATLACVAFGAVLPFTALGSLLGMRPLPPLFFGILAAMVAIYLALVEGAKFFFFRGTHAGRPLARRLTSHERRVRRVAHRWSAPRSAGHVYRPRRVSG